MKKSHVYFLGMQILCVACLAHSEMRADDSFLSWSRSDCNSIVKKTSEFGGASFGRAFAKGLFGQWDQLLGFWVTDASAKAVARITQLEERQTNDRARALFERIRSDSSEFHTLVILTLTDPEWE